ncbi:pyridoxamine 5'-phosphate oxidase family protein [Maribacter sp. BPC-D8]|uniref:pyridoxamine 5'-phosphate oxidase family protein n=1 Tax=Maribacter sp. BPC-D8 TaxID=3053613 RepID=UPI002B471148|nr:pyridoxamine 5'-phosphate oxidase family protein [Maribacter sp. BPC-D8]WRI31693.1 pyridoxamine 5'-phosphate oxidase family protein [Maribacter sp. BPC-D8]
MVANLLVTPGSQGNDGKLDASHRGGNPGFVEILEDNTLRIPDYVGNSLYNTLGNFIQNSNAGLLFVDFENKKTLQLTGEVTIIHDQNSTEDLKKTTDTGRFWTFKIKEWVLTENQHNVDWEFTGSSPFNP